MEEESLIESGRARIAGTRTKMELAWQKERESQKKLINELNTMSRDLKSTLVEVHIIGVSHQIYCFVLIINQGRINTNISKKLHSRLKKSVIEKELNQNANSME